MATQDISQLVVDVKSQGIQTAANQLDKLATSADKAEVAVKKLGTAVVGVNGMMTGGVAQTAALIGAITSLTVVINQMSQTQTRATATTRTNNEAMAEAHALARGLSGSLGALWVTYGNLAGMGIGIAIGASLKGIVSVGKDVEQTLESIRVLGGASMEDVAKMSATINDLGKSSQGPKEVAEALNVLTLAGLNAKQAMQGVQAALNLSVAGGVSIEKSAETLVQVSTALGYTADAYDHVGDVIAKTAAASMSSVDSISNAFKSAAAVGEVYGASLQDIALGLAAVANLGIQGTSAGTALKNFYKDLSASTQKVTNTLRDMKLGIADFRDANGFMLPLVDVVKKLDAGFNNLNQQQKKLAEVKMFSQQGVREFAILSQMLHTAANDTEKFGSRLEEVADQIKNAAAFSTLAAIAMGQTTTNQLKSVGNTIETVFTEVFANVQPQIGSVARSLKAAFNSQEFKTTLSSLATGIANVTKYLVEHAGALKTIAELYIGLKVAEFAAGIGKIAIAFDVATIATRAFWVSLGPIAIAIAGLTALWYAYKESKDRALDNKPAEDNLQEYADRVKEAAAKELSVLEMKKKGYSDAAIAREQQYKADEDASKRALATAEAGVKAMEKAKNDMWKNMSEQERRTAKLVQANPGTREQIMASGGSAVADYVKQSLLYNEGLEKYNKLSKEATLYTQTLMRARKQSAELDDKKVKDNKFLSEGTGTLTGKVDSKGLNDKYAAAIQGFQNDIKAANKDLNDFYDSQNAKFRAGEIGRLQLIDSTADKEIETARKVAIAAEQQRNLAEKTPNHEADVQRFQGEIDRANDTAEKAEKLRNQNKVAALREMHSQQVALEVKALEERGEYVKAANLKWSSEGKVAWEQAKKDAEEYGAVFPWLTDLVSQYAATRDAAVESATLKEDTLAFNTAMLEVQATLKGFKSDAFGSSISGLMDKATAATEKYKVALEKAKQKRDKLEKDAQGGKPEAVKAYEEANKEILAIGDKQKTMWIEVGQTITSSLKDAFGSAGESLGKLNEALIAYQNTENATAEDRMRQYGDMAQAASGFFDKQSKGYRALNGVAQVFHAAEIARTLYRTAVSVAAGAAKMFEQLGIGAPAGIAMMAATMAALGFAISGSHGADNTLEADYVQKHQGTGTILGDADAKSKSITESIDELKSNSDIMLPLTQGMLNSLKNIEASMQGLAKLAIQSGVSDGSNFNIQTGQLNAKGSATDIVSKVMTQITQAVIGPILGSKVAGAINNLWGKTTQEITDSGLQFGGKVSDLEAGKGIDQYAAIKQSSSSWFGLVKSSSSSVKTMGAGDEISRQFGLVFTNLEESLKSAAGALGSSSDAVGNAIDNVVLQTTKISLKDLKGQDLTDAINNVLSAAMDQIAKAAYPQMEAFQRVGEGYAQTVIRVATGVEQANYALEKFGITAVNYADVTNKQGDVAFEIAKQSILAYEGLSGIADMLKNMTGTVDDLTNAYSALSTIREEMNQLGLNGNGLNADMVKGGGGTTKLKSALDTYQSKYFTDAEKSAILVKSVTAEFNKLGQTLPATRSALRALIEQASKDNPMLAGQLLALTGDYDKLMSSLEDGSKSMSDGLKDTIDNLKKFKETLKGLKDSLALGDLSILTPNEKYLEAKRQYEETVSKAMSGDTTAQANVSGVAQAYLEASRTVNASSKGYTDTYNQVMADLDRLDAATDTQQTNAEKQLAALQDTAIGVGTMSKASPDIVKDLNALADAPQIPVTSNGAVAIDTTSLEDQVKDLKKQLAEAQAANAQALANLTAALFDSQAQNAAVISEAVKDTANTSAWVAQTSKNLNVER